MECKITDKNIQGMLTGGSIDEEMGIALPAGKSLAVKEDPDDEALKLKAVLADIKSAYLKQLKVSRSETICLS